MDLGSNYGRDVSNRSSTNNGKVLPSWRAQRNGYDSTLENESNSKYLDSNGNECRENGHDAFYNRHPLTDKYASRENGLQKSPSYFQANRNKSDFHGDQDNYTTKHNQFR